MERFDVADDDIFAARSERASGTGEWFLSLIYMQDVSKRRGESPQAISTHVTFHDGGDVRLGRRPGSRRCNERSWAVGQHVSWNVQQELQ